MGEGHEREAGGRLEWHIPVKQRGPAAWLLVQKKVHQFIPKRRRFIGGEDETTWLTWAEANNVSVRPQ